MSYPRTREGRWADIVPFAMACLIQWAPAQEVPARLLRPLETAATRLARAHRAEEVDELLDILAQLGLDAASLADLRETVAQRLGRSGRPEETVPSVARTLRQTAGRLARTLDDQDEVSRSRLARLLLRLDDQRELAHRALGHEQRFGQWLPAEEIALERRRGEIQDVLRRARHLPIPFSVGDSSHPLLRAVYGRTGIRLRSGENTVHSMLGPERTQRIVSAVLRASAVGEWLLTGELEPRTFAFDVLLLESRGDFERAVEIEVDNGGLEVWDTTDLRNRSSFVDLHGNGVFYLPSEAHTEALLLTHLLADDHARVLSSGLIHLLCMSVLRIPVPGPVRTSQGSGGELPEPLASAGLEGCRALLSELALQRKDPPWSRILHLEARAEPAGLDLLKNTLMVEYLCELGPLGPVIDRIKAAGSGLPPMLVEEALGRSLGEVEDAWRARMRPPTDCLATRLETPRATPSEQDALLSHLNELRAAAMTNPALGAVEPVCFDPSLSRGASLHARYLSFNPRQVETWPDAQEEHPDREGFTPAGARSGLHSWVAEQSSDPQALLDRWMGSVFHRLSLLDPGLVRIGFGTHRDLAVLDAGSMVRPVSGTWTVVWPPAGMNDVPVAGHAAMPDPVPGADESRLGYPITLQLGQVVDGSYLIEPEVEMVLREGAEDGPRVDGHFSSPSDPSVAPRRAWFLLPDSRLKAATTYFVRARIMEAEEEIVWSFTTEG